MADISITIKIKSIFKEVARRSSIATETDPFYKNSSTEEKQYSQLHGEGDRITHDFVKEAAKEVHKAYLSRQGNVEGEPYKFTDYNSSDTDAGEVVYRFNENEPLLTHRTAIIKMLEDNTRDAIVYYVLASLYRTDGNENKEAKSLAKAMELIDQLSGDLYRLHD